MSNTETADTATPSIATGVVTHNKRLCREHYRLTITRVNMDLARPGQFVHLCPFCPAAHDREYVPPNSASMRGGDWPRGTSWSPVPLLRRAFSIAGLRDDRFGAHEIDVVYRVVGTATRWMESLRVGDAVSVMGPLGNAFGISPSKRHAWMVCGGVGLPPMLWLAGALRDAGRKAILFAGARSRDLLALEIVEGVAIGADGRKGSLCVAELATCDTPVVIATDDGSLGFRGFVPEAFATYFDYSDVAADDLVVYTCGPEAMMEGVARFCMEQSIECYACVEREMACGTGTCQSCVVPVCDVSAVDGWRYALCCKEGPVFDVRRVIWSPDRIAAATH